MPCCSVITGFFIFKNTGITSPYSKYFSPLPILSGLIAYSIFAISLSVINQNPEIDLSLCSLPFLFLSKTVILLLVILPW